MFSSIPSPAPLLLIIIIPLFILALYPRLKNWAHNNSSSSATLLQKLLLASTPTPRAISTSEITDLRIYPIKSCRGLSLPRTKLCLSGLDLDRRWMLVDATTHVFLTIRQIPEMTLINTALSPDQTLLLLSIADDQNKDRVVRIPSRPDAAWLAANTTLATDIKIWDTVTDGYVYGAEVNDLFSEFLGRNVALVYKGPTPRFLQGNGDARILGRKQSTNFPDVHPVLIASQASIDELNMRLRKAGEDEITIERFRPNIIVRGGEAWGEDSWKLVRISPKSAANDSNNSTSSTSSTSSSKNNNDDNKNKNSSSISSNNGKRNNYNSTKQEMIELDIVARCTRCQVPNVDPDTAQKHRTQPWDTLMSYRRVDEGMKYKPCFGMLSAPRSEGEVAVGMRFEVLEETTEHRYIKGF